jgi:hypothetical protein
MDELHELDIHEEVKPAKNKSSNSKKKKIP